LTPPQLAVQSTPRFAGSPVTTAAKVTAVSAGTLAGGGSVIVMPVTVEMMVTEAAEALLRSVLESAVTATVLFKGTPEGAVNMVVPPLAVCAGAKDPQMGALPQVAIQSTPAIAVSLLTEAETGAEAPTVIETGGAWLIATEIIGVTDEELAALLDPHPATASKGMRMSAKGRNARQRFPEKLFSSWF